MTDKGLFPPYAAPRHQPRHPLQDALYHVLADYRSTKSIGLRAVAGYRKAALKIIRQIKDAKK